MAVSKMNKQSVLNKNSNTVFGLVTTAWYQLGEYLQRRHQLRRNKKTYQRLLENDDYLLDDIGLSRGIIQEMKRSLPNEDVSLELQKIRFTGGRYLSRSPSDKETR